MGGYRRLDGAGQTLPFALALKELVTHAVVVGGTGSGKTGLLLVMVEEVLRAQVPVLLIDVKGDLPNLLLTFPELAPVDFEPWVTSSAEPGAPLQASGDTRATAAAEAACQHWSAQLWNWQLGRAEVAAQHAATCVRVFTPGSQAGEALSVLSPLEQPSPLWQTDAEAAREALGAAVSLLLRLLGRDADPARSRDHVVLSVFAERRHRAGQSASVAELLEDVRNPPLTQIGAMPISEFLPKRERTALASALNTLLASPSFESWRCGQPLDVGAWLAPRSDQRTCATIVSVAHLDDAERALVLGIVLEQLLSWVRSQAGCSQLRALLVLDEMYGFVPPHPANPPTKRPLVSLLKQARGFGLGVVLATQNPMDLDYRALSNAGIWCVGRLSTDADRARVVEALANSDSLQGDSRGLSDVLKQLAPRWFVFRSVYHPDHVLLLQSRTTYCWLRGPMTRSDLKRALAAAAARS
jgi:hypothetical protein